MDSGKLNTLLNTYGITYTLLWLLSTELRNVGHRLMTELYINEQQCTSKRNDAKKIKTKKLINKLNILSYCYEKYAKQHISVTNDKRASVKISDR